MKRRSFISGSAAALAAITLGKALPASARQNPSVTTNKPARLKVGDQVRLVAPAGAIFDRVRFDIAAENMTGLGLKPTMRAHGRA